MSSDQVHDEHVVVEKESRPLEGAQLLPLACRLVAVGLGVRVYANLQAVARKRTMSGRVVSAGGNHERCAEKKAMRSQPNSLGQPSASFLATKLRVRRTRQHFLVVQTTRDEHG